MRRRTLEERNRSRRQPLMRRVSLAGTTRGKLKGGKCGNRAGRLVSTTRRRPRPTEPFRGLLTAGGEPLGR